MKIKLTLLSLMLCVGVMGCKNDSYYSENYDTDINGNEITNPMYQGDRIITIDSCQYVASKNNIAHKANCNNPIHTTH